MTGYLGRLLARERADVGMPAIAPRVPSLHELWRTEVGTEPIVSGSEIETASAAPLPPEFGREPAARPTAPVADLAAGPVRHHAVREAGGEGAVRLLPPMPVPVATAALPVPPLAPVIRRSDIPVASGPPLRASMDIPQNKATPHPTPLAPVELPPGTRPLRPAAAVGGETGPDPGSAREPRSSNRPGAVRATPLDPVVPRGASARPPRLQSPELRPLATGAETVVEVTIGRIEVRGVPAPAASPARPESAVPGAARLSLDQYLEQRARGSR